MKWQKKQLKNALALNFVKRKRYITEQGLQLADMHRPFEIDSLQICYYVSFTNLPHLLFVNQG